MNNVLGDSAFGEILEKGKQASVQAAKTAVSDTSNTIQGQIGIKNEQGINSTSVNNQQQKVNVNEQNPILENQNTNEMVQDSYSSSNDSNQSVKTKEQDEYETQQKLLKVRQELHQQVYYDPLFAYEHKKAVSHQDEEQQKEQIKLKELEEKEKKKLPTAVQNAKTTVEVNRGVSG